MTSRIPSSQIEASIPRLPILVLIVATSLTASCGGGKPTVELGVILPLTGRAGDYGKSIQRGIELAHEAVAKDEALAYEVKLTVRDTASDAKQAADLASEVFENAIATIGGATSDEALAMIEPLKRADKLLLSPSASSPKLSGAAPGMFYRIYPSAEAEAATMAIFVEKTLKADAIVLLVQDNVYGKDLAAELKKVAPTVDVAIAAELSFPEGARDFSSLVAQAMATEVKTLYLAASGPDLAVALQALHDGGFDDHGYHILSGSAIAIPAVLKAAGQSAWGVYYTQTPLDFASDQEPMKSFVAAYRAKFGQEPDLWSAYGYDALNVCVQALREGGATVAGQFQRGMRTIREFPGVTGSIQFRESGDVQQFMRIFYVHEGQLVDWKPWQEKRLEDKRREFEENQKRLEQLLREGAARN